MAEALIWLHGFGGGVFVGVLVGLWLGLSNRKPADVPPCECAREEAVLCSRECDRAEDPTKPLGVGDKTNG